MVQIHAQSIYSNHHYDVLSCHLHTAILKSCLFAILFYSSRIQNVFGPELLQCACVSLVKPNRTKKWNRICAIESHTNGIVLQNHFCEFICIGSVVCAEYIVQSCSTLMNLVRVNETTSSFIIC